MAQQYGGGKAGGEHILARRIGKLWQGSGFSDNLGIIIAVDVPDSRNVDRTGGKHAIPVLLPGDEEAVGGSQKGHGIIGKEFSLIEPGLAQVSGQVLELPEPGIAVGGKHLRMGVDEYIRALHLLEELMQ